MNQIEEFLNQIMECFLVCGLSFILMTVIYIFVNRLF